MTLIAPYIVRRSERGSKFGPWIGGVVVVALASLPFVVYQSTTSSFVMLFVLMVLAGMWNLLAGFGGLVSIGQQAYIGIGAYTVVALDAQGVNPFLAVLFSAVTAVLLAYPTSLLAFRLRGDYFAVGTWVIAEVYRLVLIRFDSLGGASGKTLTGLGGIDPAMRGAIVYWLALSVAVVTVIGCFVLLRGRIGLSLTAIRDDEVAARAGGVDATKVKRIVYLVSAAGCAVAGGVLAVDSVRVQPDAIFSVQWAAYMIVIVVIGGIGHLEGPIVGAIVFFALQYFLADLGTWYLMILGLLAMFFAIVVRKGIWGLLVGATGYRMFPTVHTLSTKARK
ncbi:branched-chain amino acid ABC transporter permease [Pseudonocardia sp. GCM10023141]|uniref:branched-chain amino acid ABC transporter permease n=1 Tax=Pseudonocardia sp. GCM10023141 TaxID=3252653 RepID=UPI003605CA9C